ncbi:DUF3884 family protein [Bacillus cereus]|uniref:DUF3884 domain-containing protein n=2 Tax=Bacillus cereus group TaxID=86661 RepID=A0A9W5KSE4_BACCE|nr:MULTISPECIES: DUF3884 family protein [Bacillus cereus group]MEB8733050.1 DUF3884 family protein [Bacillus cereus]EEM49550.1 hypothetical protein bthur0005_4930 [Bacillus thuringiensis serovar pakistani str. T13001]EJR67488.1 hypothetical protein IK5_05297 [Bacillus cereus VD154]KIU73123.1 hypothetical protein C797_19684 [Bacillus thuringiensis Sbt003]MEB8751789.1 DUF3884 family protein [Bacillus cereus]
MTHSKDKKSHAFKGIGEKLTPTIYQVRFMKLDEPIRFESFPELKELGDWLSTSTHMWSCDSTMYKYNREEFEKKFLEITKLTADHVLISTGGVGFNFMSPGWRNSL